MRKLQLDLETLAVESFATGEAKSGGTVRGEESAGETCGCPAPPPTGKSECTCPPSDCGWSCCYSCTGQPCP